MPALRCVEEESMSDLVSRRAVEKALMERAREAMEERRALRARGCYNDADLKHERAGAFAEAIRIVDRLPAKREGAPCHFCRHRPETKAPRRFGRACGCGCHAKPKPARAGRK